jgi:hypothetical protein
MNKIKVQSNMFNAGSNLNWPRNYITLNPTSYDVYSVYESEKHYPWCSEQTESVLEKLAVGLAFVACVVVLSFALLVVF